MLTVEVKCANCRRQATCRIYDEAQEFIANIASIRGVYSSHINVKFDCDQFEAIKTKANKYDDYHAHHPHHLHIPMADPFEYWRYCHYR